MPKKYENIEKRREQIKERLDKSANTSEEVKKIAKELFLSERTIWYDYKNS
jgi:prefoldin subunit 5